MAKVTYTAIVQEIRGSVAGSTFKGTKGGGIILHRPRPKQTRTDAQYDKRRIMSLISSYWLNLTADDKQLWGEYASLTKNRQSGYNAYQQLNLRLLSANYSTLITISQPPPTPITPTAIANFTKIVISSVRNELNWTTPSSYSYFTQVYYCVEVGYHMDNKESWRLLTTIPSIDGYCYHDHSYPIGTQLKYHARTLDAYGRISPRTEKI